MQSPQEIVRAGLPRLLSRLWRYGLVLSRDEATAEDLVQAACVRAIERAEQFRPGTRLDRWVFAILRSIWLNELRGRRIRQGAGTVEAAEVLIYEGQRHLEQHILAGQVLTEVQRLPEVQRETLFLVYVEGLSYQEAADALQIPIGTVMSRLTAARAKLAHLGDVRELATGIGRGKHDAEP